MNSLGHVLVAGRTQSGKSTLVKALMRLTARAVVLDARLEYNVPGARVYYDLEQAARAFVEQGPREGIIVCRFREPEDHLAMLEVVMTVQNASKPSLEDPPTYGPVVVVLEEASRYSETMVIDERIRTAYNQGRHDNVFLMTVIQIDTDIHRVTRGNSEVIVSFAQNRLSTDMSRYFQWEQVRALRSLREPGEYTTEPIQGRHFVTYPPEIDLYEEWLQSYGYINEETI